MDDLTKQLGQLLSDPQAMGKLREMAASLGLSEEASREPASPPAQPAPQRTGPDLSALAGLLSSPGESASGPDLPGMGLTPEMLQAVGRLAPLLTEVNREDDSIRLLRALRPLLGEARQKKLDEAVRILQMLRLLPLLRSSGLISGLFPGILS